MKKVKEFESEEVINSSSRESYYKGKEYDWEKQAKL